MTHKSRLPDVVRWLSENKLYLDCPKPFFFHGLKNTRSRLFEIWLNARGFTFLCLIGPGLYRPWNAKIPFKSNSKCTLNMKRFVWNEWQLCINTPRNIICPNWKKKKKTISAAACLLACWVFFPFSPSLTWTIAEWIEEREKEEKEKVANKSHKFTKAQALKLGNEASERKSESGKKLFASPSLSPPASSVFSIRNLFEHRFLPVWATNISVKYFSFENYASHFLSGIKLK